MPALVTSYLRKKAGTGHKSLSILFRDAHNLLSARDPDTCFVALGKGRLTSVRLAVPAYFAHQNLFKF